MIDKIEVYIRNKEVVTGQAIIGRPISDGATTHYCTVREISKTAKVMPEADMAALEVVNEFAKEEGLNIEVYDISTFKGKLKANLKRVKTTPTIIIGNVKIEGEHTPEPLKSKLKSYLGK